MNRGHGDKLSRKQEAAVSALLMHGTIGEAAKSIGIHDVTLRRWMLLPSFREAYREAACQLVESALGRLQAITGEAVDCLHRNLSNADARIAVRAAIATLDHAFKAAEVLELAAEIQKLKAQLTELSRVNLLPHAGSFPDTRAGAAADGPGLAGPSAIAGGPGADPGASGDDAGPLATDAAALFGEEDLDVGQ